MIEAITWAALGLTLLTAGGHFLVRSASAIALLSKLTPAVIGLTVVAVGTSLPEFFVGISAHSNQYFDLLVGNLIGSNILNIALVVGLSSLILPTLVSKQAIKKEWPAMIFITGLSCFFLFNQNISRTEGMILIAVTIGAVLFFVKIGRDNHEETSGELTEIREKIKSQGKKRAIAINSIELIISIVCLNFGSDFFVKGATGLAEIWGLSERVIGITVVAIGTSLPELMVSLVGTIKGRSDVALGNIMGSNIFNIGGILGVCATKGSFSISENIVNNDIPWLIGISFLLFFTMLSGKSINRWKGAFLFGSYCVYTALLF